MVSSALLPLRLRGEEGFRWRGGSVARLESLSDAVSAVALSLLVIGRDMPRTGEDLLATFWLSRPSRCASPA